MARNKYPEETERKILEVSRRLFEAQGYEHTTIADIVRELGMSKGAVYHHFQSKEQIYDRITDAYYMQQDWYTDLSAIPGETGLAKMRWLFAFLLSDPEKVQLDSVSSMMKLNPRMVALALDATIHQSAPMVQQLIEMGNADGSVQVTYPQETAEAFMLLMNMWIGIFTTTREDFMRKLFFIRDFSNNLGMPVLDETVMAAAERYYDEVMGPMTPQ